MKKRSKGRLATFFIIYLMVGLLFAVCFAVYYRWPPLGYFSPGFYAVILTWPLQLIGFVKDIFYYGLQGKPF